MRCLVDWHRCQQRTRPGHQKTDVGAGVLSDAGEQSGAAFHFDLDGGILFVGAVHGQLERYLLTMRQGRHADRLVRMDAAFIQREECGAYVAQSCPGIILQGDIGIGHLAHAVCNVDAGVAAQYFYTDS